MAARSPTLSPWYAEGLRFRCEPDCGACCRNHGEYAYVYLSEQDFERLCAHLELDPEVFAERYTELDGGHMILRMDDPACPFLDGDRCGVYEARPVQCRTFPFWPELVRSRKRWQALRSFCPGIDNGDVHALPQIREQLVQIQDEP